MIVDSSQLRDFWAGDAGRSLKCEGCFGVDLDGELLTCEEYKQQRLQSLECALLTDPLALSPEVEYEAATYLDLIAPWVCDAEEEAWLLAELPELLRHYLNKLGQILDLERYAVDIQVAPLSRRRVIAVHVRRDPGQAWLLRYGCDVEAFLKWYRRSAPSEESAGGPELGSSLE